jgi:protein dithiol oxidoreductase (disulfide-forming)
MVRVNKILLSLCFVLAMGCGEQSSGESGQNAAAAPSVPAAAEEQQEQAPQQIAALADTKGTETATSDMASVAAQSYVEGTHYERLPKPVPTSDKNRIEVAEVFWYGCSHCYDFEPVIQDWAKTLPDDVVLVKSPAMWDNQGVMANHARIYYTAKALGVEAVISPIAFKALNVERQPLRTEDEIAKLFTDNGVSRQDFDRTFKSFGVTSSVRQAESRQRSYRVQGTPEVIVDGTYRVASRMAGSQEAVLKVTDFLIDKIRQEKVGK